MLEEISPTVGHREGIPVPQFSVEVPDGEDTVSVRWKGIRFALIPHQNEGIHLFDDMRAEVGMLLNNPNPGFTEDDVMDHMTFSLEVPPQSVQNVSNRLFKSTTPPVVKAGTNTFIVYVDDTIDDVQSDAILAAAKKELMNAAKRWKVSK